MVIKLLKFCLCLILYHKVQVLVMANMSSSHIFSRNTRDATSIKLHENDINLIDTPGCTIPNIWAEYRIVEANDCKNRCGTRGVFINKLKDTNIIVFTINKKAMEEIFGNNTYTCCSQFAYLFVSSNQLEFTDCEPFVHGTQMLLQQEIITVQCISNGVIYKDAYILVQKLEREAKKRDGNSWNVLLLGMDSMSRGRAIQSMPKLVKYFEKNGWLDYRAFQKAEDNTYPNLMITFTGIYSYDVLVSVCKNKKYICNDLFIWSKFRLSGFITAYGEDGLSYTFRDTITKKPTDHYLRSFFFLGTEPQGNIVCLRRRPCAYHILDYAYQFAEAYKDEKYFGAFWTTDYSHDPSQIPTLLQNQYINLFKKFDGLGSLNNTIIFFYGDHGVRYGHLRIPAASYYDTRLPMLYMWFPHSFRKRFEDKYHNLKLNQHRLTTHSDLHSTLWDILKLSDENVTIIPPTYCRSCGSLFKEKPKDRRCEDMNVAPRWCSCYVLNNVSSTDIAATQVPKILIKHINRKQNTSFGIDKILRHQWFTDIYKDNRTYYVIAIQVTAKRQYEGVLKEFRSNFIVQEPIDNISPDDRVYDFVNCRSGLSYL